MGFIILGLAVIGMLLCGFGLIYFIVPKALIPAIHVFNEELTALEITKASFKWGAKNWLVIFGLIIVTGIVAELGLVDWGIRILFTAMLSKIPIYFIHKEGVESPNGDGSYSYFFGLNATLGSNMHLMFKTTQ
ncbi:hypothetical protein [Pareuzebyella sediminis]|uniref:hypothetical protein n=1 Tax=Pareuzebyella sediminis TaxID=2607998 RepID=UPI0018E10B5D|nr:hypothetical protein [Pareuzebyella sediminis]